MDYAKFPSTFIGQDRSIEYRSPSAPVEQKGPDIVFKFVVMMRNNQHESAQDYVTPFNEQIATVTDEVVDAWLTMAIATWEGYPGVEIPAFSIQLPARQEPHVTVWGTIVDSVGRNISLTLTDQSDPAEAWDFIQRGLWVYDEITARNGVLGDQNKFGHLPHFKTTAVAMKPKATRGKFTGTPKKAAPAAVDTSSAVQCTYMADVRKLAANAIFEMPIAKAEIWESKEHEPRISLFGFTNGASNLALADTSDSVWIYPNNTSFASVEAALKSLGVSLGNPVKFTMANAPRVVGRKKLASNRASYDTLSIKDK